MKEINFISILLLLLLSILISCQDSVKNNFDETFTDTNQNDTYLNISGLDTLKFEKTNYVNYKYFNKNYNQYKINKDRFLKLYYVVGNEIFEDEIENISNYNYETIEDINIEDSLYINTFGLYGDKIYTFIVLDMIQIPKGDSVQIKYIEERYIFNTFIKR